MINNSDQLFLMLTCLSVQSECTCITYERQTDRQTDRDTQRDRNRNTTERQRQKHRDKNRNRELYSMGVMEYSFQV